jgi:hypothetical protein
VLVLLTVVVNHVLPLMGLENPLRGSGVPVLVCDTGFPMEVEP